MPCRRMPSPRPPPRPSRWWTDRRGRQCARIAAALRESLPRTSAETDVRAGGCRKAERSSSPPDPGGLLCLRRGDRFFRYVRPAPLGSLVQRELAAVRLTEGLIRAFLHCGRYLQPLRHGAERRATSPYTGEASPSGDVFSLRPQCRSVMPAPRGEGLKRAQQTPANGKRPCRNGQTGRGVSIGEMELEKGIIMLLGGEIACQSAGGEVRVRSRKFPLAI